MPAAIDRCVEDKLADPDFEPKEEGQSKEDAAWALCTWLYNEGFLKEDADEKKMSKKNGRPFRVTLPLIRADAPEWWDQDEVGLWILVEASGPERDSRGTRMSPKCLERMVEYAEQGINDGPLPFLDGHYYDLLAAVLGDIYAPHLTEENHFAFYTKLDECNPQSVRLYNDLAAGKRHGASIAGWVHEEETETWTNEATGKQEDAILFHDIELIEVSRTSWPSWRPAFCELVAKRVGEVDSLSANKSRDARKVRDGVVFCTPDGSCTQLVQDDGKVNVHTFYGATLALVHALAPETATQGPEQVFGSAAFESGMIDKKVVLACAKSGATFVSALDLSEQLELSDKVAGVFRSHLLTRPPILFSSAVGRARDKHKLYQFVAQALPIAINSTEVAMTKKVAQAVVEEEVLEEEIQEEDAAETEEEVADTSAVSLSRGELADTVDARLLSARFSEATWAMQDLVYGALFSDAVSVEDRLARADAIIDEFSTIAQGIIRDMIKAGYVPVSSDELRMLSVMRVETTEAVISRARADRIEQVAIDTVSTLSELLHLVQSAELPDAEAEEEEDAAENDEGDEVEQEQAKAVVSSLIEERLGELAESRRQQADSLLQVLRSGGPLPTDPEGQTAEPIVARSAADTEALEKDQIERQFLQSLDGGRRRR